MSSPTIGFPVSSAQASPSGKLSSSEKSSPPASPTQTSKSTALFSPERSTLLEKNPHVLPAIEALLPEKSQQDAAINIFYRVSQGQTDIPRDELLSAGIAADDIRDAFSNLRDYIHYSEPQDNDKLYSSALTIMKKGSRALHLLLIWSTQKFICNAKNPLYLHQIALAIQSIHKLSSYCKKRMTGEEFANKEKELLEAAPPQILQCIIFILKTDDLRNNFFELNEVFYTFAELRTINNQETNRKIDHCIKYLKENFGNVTLPLMGGETVLQILERI